MGLFGSTKRHKTPVFTDKNQIALLHKIGLSDYLKVSGYGAATFSPAIEIPTSAKIIKELIEIGEDNPELATLVPKLVRLYMAKRLS